MNFEVQEEEIEPGVFVIRLSGQFDFSHVATARSVINQRIVEGARLIVINLDELEYIDSAGLGVLVGTLARLRENDGELAIVCRSPRIRRVFDITKLTQLLVIYDTEAEALAPNARAVS